MKNYSSNNKRIAKNTLMLYIRMLLIMVVTLYTSRVILEALGVEDFGIYNVVGTVVIAFSFISGPLGTATQRFLNYELGKNNLDSLNKIFSVSLLIYALLSVALFLIITIIGIWFIENKMQFPIERMEIVKWTFYFSILTFITNLFKTCFEALIISHERMGFYAYLGIMDVLLRLINAILLLYLPVDKLQLFAFNQFVIAIIILICAIFYVRKKISHIQIRFIWDTKLFKELLNFSGWSLFGSVATMSANQGLNILLNTFYGVTINAAMGIANQVSSAVNQFVLNFQTAFRPQIVKSYASNDIDYLQQLIFKTGKFSYFLLFAIAIPIIFNIDYILQLWLGCNVPKYASQFCILMLLYSLLETLSGPLWMTIQATGKIKKYQLYISSLISLNIFLSYLFLDLGYPPIIVLEIKCILDVSFLIVRIIFVHKIINLSIPRYIKEVIIPILSVSIIIFIVFFIIRNTINTSNILTLLQSSICFYILFFILLYLLGLQKKEREFILNIINKHIYKIK